MKQHTLNITDSQITFNNTSRLNFALILDNDFNGVAPPLSAGNMYSYTNFGDVIYTLTYIPD